MKIFPERRKTSGPDGIKLNSLRFRRLFASSNELLHSKQGEDGNENGKHCSNLIEHIAFKSR
jgi:hypothetical protein